MDVLSFDIGSGGITAARIDENLVTRAIAEISWDLRRDASGRATLSVDEIQNAFKRAAAAVHANEPAAALSIACFMHSFLVVDSAGEPTTPVFTWLDTTSAENIGRIRSRVGEAFHERTGCHYHPMFPVFKLPSTPVSAGCRVISPKTMLVHALTGSYTEDYGMAAASGLLNARSGRWDEEILAAAGISVDRLPGLQNPYDVVSRVNSEGAAKFGIAEGTIVVNGSGDGFLANVGSASERPKRMAITLGTSTSVRQVISEPRLDLNAGTFCYRASSDAFLLGCAGSNGGNALDWAKTVLGDIAPAPSRDDIPVFLPWLNGERSFEWDPNVRAIWSGLGSEHTSADLMRAVVEGVIFNIVQYTEVVQRVSGVAAEEIVLSGNGFLNPVLAPLIASLVSAPVLQPPSIGQASLRGAAVYAWRALGLDARPTLEKLLAGARIVPRVQDGLLAERYERFKQLRARSVRP